MLNRTFGPEDTPIPVLGLGCSRIGSFNNPAPWSELRQTLETALEAGVTLFDTADIYGQGDSERAVGRLLERRREAAFVVSKVGKTFSTRMRLIGPLKPLLRPLARRFAGIRGGVTARREASMAHDFSPAYVARALDRSLARLRFETLDALLLHSPPAEALADPALAETLEGLRLRGRIRHFGVSCDDAACLKAALAMPGITLLELPLDLIEAADNAALIAAAAERRIGIIAREVIRLSPGVAPPLAVRRALERPGVTCVVAGTSSSRHLAALAEAVGAVRGPEDRAKAPAGGIRDGNRGLGAAVGLG